MSRQIRVTSKPMRQGQQNRRGRGRGRKPQNPLARNYESNGPDVKIRGTAAHIAEKYMSLARDALASGDLIAAESYFQHAEHYNRIIMAAQSQFGPQHGQHQGEGPNGGFRQQPRWNADGSEDDGDFDAGEGGPTRLGEYRSSLSSHLSYANERGGLCGLKQAVSPRWCAGGRLTLPKTARTWEETRMKSKRRDLMPI